MNSPRTPQLALLALTGLAFALRSHDLAGRSLWWDESLSLHRTGRDLIYALSNVIALADNASTLETIDNHPPLYFVLLYLFRQTAGDSEFALRFLSVAASVLLVPLLWATGRRLLGQEAGLLAALVGAVSPMFLWYGQEARMYTLLTTVGLLSVYLLWRTADEWSAGQPRRWGWAIALTLSLVVLPLVHYLGFLLVGIAGITLFLLLRSRGDYRPALALLVIVALPILPSGLFAVTQAIPPAGEVSGLRFVPLPVLLSDLLNSFSLGLSVKITQVFWIDLLYAAVALFGLVWAWQQARRTAEAGRPPLPRQWITLTPGREKVLFTLAYLALPVVIIYALSYLHPVYMTSRHLILVAPAFYLLLGAGLNGLWEQCRPLFWIALLGLVVSTGYSTLNYFSVERYRKDDNRAAGDYLRQHLQPGDAVIVNPPQIADLYRYYGDSGAPWIGLPRLGDSSYQLTDATLRDWSRRYPRLWFFLSSTPQWGDPEGYPEQWLRQHAIALDEQQFHGYGSVVKTTLYLTTWPVTTTLPQPTQRRNLNFEGVLQLAGYDAPAGVMAAGHDLGLRFYWQATMPLQDDFYFSYRLDDAAGRPFTQTDHQPLNGHWPTNRWPVGAWVTDWVDLSIPVTTPPGTYTLSVTVYQPDSGRHLAALNPDGLPQGTTVRLGDIPVGPADRPAGRLTIPGPAADFDRLALLGHTWTTSNTLNAGETASLSLFWQAKAALPENYILRLRLMDRQQQPQWEKDYPLTGDLPTRQWPVGQPLQGRYDLDLPVTLVPGPYQLYALVHDPAARQALPGWPASWPALLARGWQHLHGGDGAVPVASLTITNSWAQQPLPTIPHRVEASWQEGIRLLGYDLPQQELVAGQPLHLTLFWQTDQPVATNYTVFVHIVSSAGQTVAQQDNPPARGARPTRTWRPGEIIRDEYEIAVKPGTPPGPYQLRVGLYTPATGQRLPLTTTSQPAADAFVLTPDLVISKSK